jgi:hypothetical protein
MKNVFKKHKCFIRRHWDLDFKSYVNIEILPYLSITYYKYSSLKIYSLDIGWLWFSVEFCYEYYKINKE